MHLMKPLFITICQHTLGSKTGSILKSVGWTLNVPGLIALVFVGLGWGGLWAGEERPPNIVIYLADDLGYGSINPFGAEETLIKTPTLTRLSEQGVKFTDAYATASVCSPTRYTLLTGRYSWRGRLQYGVVNATDPLLIEADVETLAEWLQDKGYRTSHIGKWHLGYKDGPFKNLLGDLTPGPNEVGFDYHFGVPNNMDDVHKVYVENNSIYGLRSDKISPYGRSFYGKLYTGYDAPQRNEPEVMHDLTQRAVEWIQSGDKSEPFFLHFSSVAVHHPIMPSESNRGKSNAGAYGDFLQDLDESVGTILSALEKEGMLENTVFIFTSDNGGDIPEDQSWPEIQAQTAGLAINGSLRGDKHTIYEGGIRVPLLVSWPKKLTPHTSTAFVTTADLFATVADIVDNEAPLNGSAPDSLSFYNALLQKPASKNQRTSGIFRDVHGRKAIRFGHWKLIDNWFPNKATHRGELELYNLQRDPAESINLAQQQPDLVKQGQALLRNSVNAM